MSRKCVGAAALLSGLFVLYLIPICCFGADQGASKGWEKLLNIGAIGSEHINVSVWTNKPSGHKFKTGERVIIYFKADKDCYLTALNVSAQGDVTVLFPSKEHPESFLKAGRKYSLFDDDSSVRLTIGKGVPEVKAVFYVTAGPISLDPLVISENQPVVHIPHKQQESIDILAARIQKASAAPGFNRVILAIKSEPEGGPNLKLMGPAPRPLPSRPGGEPPESLTGTQGVKPDTGR